MKGSAVSSDHKARKREQNEKGEKCEMEESKVAKRGKRKQIMRKDSEGEMKTEEEEEESERRLEEESQHIDRSDLSAARQSGRRLSLCCHSLACRHLTPSLLLGLVASDRGTVHLCVCVHSHVCLCVW